MVREYRVIPAAAQTMRRRTPATTSCLKVGQGLGWGRLMGPFAERVKMVFTQPLYHTVQSLLRPPGLRRFFAAIEAKTRPAKTRTLDAPRAREIYEALQTRGHTEDLRPFSDAQIKEMYDFLVARPMADYATPEKVAFTYPDVPKNCHTAIYPLETVVRIPHLFEFASQRCVRAHESSGEAFRKSIHCRPNSQDAARWSGVH